MRPIISGIQQVGIGIPNVHEAWTWYRKHFGMDISIFEEAAEANLMLPYTGGKPHQRHAILAINVQGGGGFEIWQYTSRTPQPPVEAPVLGDYGIFVTRIKSQNVQAAYESLKGKGAELLSAPTADPGGKLSFFLKDPYGNHFQVVEQQDTFSSGPHLTAGPAGVMIGVSDIEASRKLYSDILGYDTVVYDETGTFEDLNGLPNGGASVRRVLLTHAQPRKGGFSNMFGKSFIELVALTEGTGKNMFEGRFWGDLGYIHLCFDIYGMDELRTKCESNGFPFTVDSAASLGKSFDMGEAAGLFSYIEDPDGTLIEFVETHKVPIMKKLGWYINMTSRNPEKALPNWMLKALRFNRTTD